MFAPLAQVCAMRRFCWQASLSVQAVARGCHVLIDHALRPASG
jgi:hypothetical protein